MLQRTLDFIVSLLAFLIFSLLFVLISLAVKLDSPGPVFYRAQRVGKDGVPFRLYECTNSASWRYP